MTSAIVLTRVAWERFEIHAATCRARRAALACSTCTELADRFTQCARRVLEAA